jgi:enamine deaminase RidA (YjgF/YER057c/UK114 family)
MDHIIDPATAGFEGQWHFSHVVRSRGLLFLSGVTGTGTDGRVAEDPGEQSERLFRHLRQYLNAAVASLDDLVEITTYHVGLHTHLRAFTRVKDAYLPGPYPAWSAIGVSQLITPGALVELRAIAEDPAAT